MKTIKQIKNFSNYSISTSGEIFSHKRCGCKGGKLNPSSGPHGYQRVTLCKNGKVYFKSIHRLVLETFVGPCPKGMEACHNDGNPANNQLNNLRWDTHKENGKDMIRHETSPKGENHGMAKLKEQDVRMIIYIYRTREFSQREIGKMFGVTHITVRNIVNKKTWKYIWN